MTDKPETEISQHFRYFEMRLEGLEKAVEVASVEREKSAQALQLALSKEIESGDKALLLHIDAQKQEVNALRESTRQENKAAVEIRELTNKMVDERFEALEKQQRTADHESEKKNAELNDVRLRFIPREVFDAYKESQYRSLEEYKAEQARRVRTISLALASMAITLIGIAIPLLLG